MFDSKVMNSYVLAQFILLISFYIPCKLQKASGIERDQWHEMVYRDLVRNLEIKIKNLFRILSNIWELGQALQMLPRSIFRIWSKICDGAFL